jgi:DNA-binding transcriptional ArsR family regulator
MATTKSTSSTTKARSKSVAHKVTALNQKNSPKKVAVSAKSAGISKKKVIKPNDMDLMFDLAAETFRVMSAPMRLKIINCLCNEEKNVGQLLDEINTTQPNMSQHLNTLHKAKILGRRREGVQIYYRIINERVVTLCRAVCTQIAIDSDIAHP